MDSVFTLLNCKCVYPVKLCKLTSGLCVPLLKFRLACVVDFVFNLLNCRLTGGLYVYPVKLCKLTSGLCVTLLNFRLTGLRIYLVEL